MLMADTVAIFFVILGLMLALPGLWLLCRGLWPRAVAGAAARCNAGLIKTFLVGLPITTVMIFLTAVLNNALGTFGKVAAIGVVCLYVVYAHTGVAGLATCLGERLASPVDAIRPWRATLRGGIVLELTYLLPILGWFVILPLSTIIGAGAVTLALLRRKKVAPVMVPPTEPFVPPAAHAEVAGVPLRDSLRVPR